MQFSVPQFIERESKIWLNMSFTQFIYIGTGGAICFVLYLVYAKTSFLLFIMATIIIMSLAGAMAFLKVGGRSLPTVLKNFLFFSTGPKIYLWRRKNVSPRMFEKAVDKPKTETAEPSALKMAEKSRLRSLSNILETKK